MAFFFFLIPRWNSNNKLKNRYRTADNTQNTDMLKYSKSWTDRTDKMPKQIIQKLCTVCDRFVKRTVVH